MWFLICREIVLYSFRYIIKHKNFFVSKLEHFGSFHLPNILMYGECWVINCTNNMHKGYQRTSYLK